MFLGSALIVPITFRVFNAENYALISLIISLLMLTSTAISSPVLHSISRYYNRLSDGCAPFIRCSVVCIRLGIIGLLIVFFCGWALGIHWTIGLILVIIATLPFDVFRENFSSYFNANEFRHLFGINQFLYVWLKAIFVLLIGLFPPNKEISPFYFFLCCFFASIITCIFSYFLMNPVIKITNIIKIIEEKKSNLNKKELRFSLGFAVIGILTWTQLWADKWALGLHLKSDLSYILGAYIASSQIVNAPYQLILSAFLIYYGPKLYLKLNNGTVLEGDSILINKFMAKPLKIYVLVSTLGFLLSIFIVSPVCSLVLGASFNIGNATLILLSLGAAINGISGILAFQLQTMAKFQTYIFCFIVASFVFILLLFFTVKYWGENGAAIAVVLVAALKYLMLSFFIRKNEQKKRA